jgi:hypothetical protein
MKITFIPSNFKLFVVVSVSPEIVYQPVLLET